MSDSLQAKLLENIKSAYPSWRTIDELYAIGVGHKQSLCERKLRILRQSGLIESIKDDKGRIKGYMSVKFTLNLPRHEAKQGERIQERLFKLSPIIN